MADSAVANALPAQLPTSPDTVGNRNYWSIYDWSGRGEEWSVDWGGSEGLWYGSLYPRLHAFLPARHILEIAPGFGRVTQYLKGWCEEFTAVDLVERCVEHCRKRFADTPHARFLVNDGRSLEMIEDGSIDLIVSWDSLVHVEHETVREYLRQLAKKLKPGGTGFIHHSNLGEHTGELPRDLSSDLFGGRRASMSAEKFRADCAAFGLRCIAQEIISTNDNGYWTDAISLFSRDPGGVSIPARVEYRHDWAVEKANARRVAEMYRRAGEVG